MSLFQVSFSIIGDQVDALEELLFEVDEGRWNMYLDQDTQVGVASGVYESELEAQDDWNRIEPFFEELLGKLNPDFQELPDTDWKDSYKVHFKPWSFKGLHWVPVWEKETYPIPDGDAVVWLDPGMAFGTGNHETTRLCIEALIEFLKTRDHFDASSNKLSCCDAGCGSGILAISAKKLGVSTVVGFDNDADAVRISHENLLLNDLAGEVDFLEGDLETGFQEQAYDLVFANILAVVLIEQPYALITSVKSGGRLILSGILTKELREVRTTYKEKLNRIGKSASITSHSLGEWSDVVIDID
ncbi:MAG: 50S ribosomal protein L11 methyltransferase [Verrucomicrobia bacterium]|nr:50S ribosomal protein L11 methyltransferase [Verrucomicrobiota bacterium]MDA1067473.1 50S ribosomal protein L11 methyltransferase [Verrucomicrobiota bacterium]